VDDILLASSDVSLLRETKKFLSSNFDMKDLGEASYVLGIEIHRDKSNATPAPIVKGESFGKFQYPKKQYEIDQMKAVPYASAVGNLQYALALT
jgi:hypothetical protein